MNAFRFPLERVLGWRRTELEVEEHKFQQLLAAVAAVDREMADLAATRVQAETTVREWSPLSGSDLAALGSFRLYALKKNTELAARRVVCAKRVADGRNAMLEARRRFRLLERLRERRYEEWRLAGDKELEDLASESYLARWAGNLHSDGK
jgi:flagellar export protein FliJ